MSTLKPGKPSGFAEEAANTMGARWPRVPLSSDHDDGGVSLGIATHQSPPQNKQEKEHSKLNATSKPFVPGMPSSTAAQGTAEMNNGEAHSNTKQIGKNNGKELVDEPAFNAQNNISDKLIHMYHERQRRVTDAAATGQVQHNPQLQVHHPVGLPPSCCPPPIPQGYRAGLPGSASDGNMLGSRHVRGGPDTAAVVPYKAAQQQDPVQPKVLPPLQFQPVAPEVQSQRSEVLNMLTGPKGNPSYGLLDPFFVPFMDIWEHARADEWGVIRIKNIPFGTTRSEVVAMVGRNSKILSDSYEPVHIIMERVSSKTMDAFVEFSSFTDAVEAAEKFQRNSSTGRVGRIGNRHVEVELSSQAQLMRALFPVARVAWAGARPQVRAGSQFPWENFRAFFTEEEMTMLTKHVECPQRAQSSFAQDCPERPYECMISTLKKIPWYMAQHITIKQRHAVYETCCKMISTLSTTIDKFPNHQRLTTKLLNRLVNAAMLCWGFSVQQKDNIALLARMDEGKARQFNQPRFGDFWCHLYTLGPKPGVPLDVLEYYISIIREETKRAVDSLNIGQKIALQTQSGATNGYFGYLWVEVDFPAGPDFDCMTLAEANQRELQAVDRILRRAVEGGIPPPAYTDNKGDGNAAPATHQIVAYSPQFN